MRTPLSRSFVPLLAAAAFVAAGCDREPPQLVTGDVEVVFEKDGVQASDRAAELDFGSVFMGSSEELTIRIRNRGIGTVTLTGIVPDGNPTKIGDSDVVDPVFTVAFVPGTTVVTSGIVEIPVTFNPPQADADVVEHGVTLTFQVENDKAEATPVVVHLKGLGVAGHCDLPTEIVFGKVARGDAFRQSVEVRNLSDILTTATVSPITSNSGDHNAFTFAPESAQGDFSVEPKQSRQVLIDFRPSENKTYLAFVKMRAAAQCPEVNVTLTGTGVETVLDWSPKTVDCGYVTPGVEVTREITFTNGSLQDAQLTQIRTQNTTEFRVVSTSTGDAASMTVPGNDGTATMTVACKPAVLGPRQTMLSFKTDLASQPEGNISLTVRGGGPDIQVQPSPNLGFGKVAYFAGVNPPSFAKRKLTVMNVGTAPVVADNKGNLRLGAPDANGEPTLPYVSVESMNPETAPTEFDVKVPASYDMQKGLVAKVGENMVDLEVTFTPISVGLKQAKITIFSNDPDEPAVEVVVSANAVDVPPCNYTVSPTQLAYGLIESPNYRDLAFTITNHGTDPGEICLLSGLALSGTTHPFFSLPGGTIDSYEMAAGEQLNVTVRVHPQGATPSGVTPIIGSVDFFMSSPSNPQAQVGLSAQLAPSCLTIAPDDIDFGTVQVGCSSVTRTFSVYNTCTNTVTINSFAMQAAAGQPAGGPDCPGGQPCPEFILTQAPPVPTGGIPLAAGSAALTFQAKYTPIDFGSDSGAIAVNATQNGANVTYVVSLKGRGDATGIHTDVFNQDLKPKADLLIAIDHSGSMSTPMQMMGAHFGNFIKFANTAKVDYNMAVISAVLNVANFPLGHFLTGPSHPEKILTPNTPDVENKFKDKVNIQLAGGTEDCLQPLLAAVTPPLVNNQNAGFLRDDASLAFICVTDAVSQCGSGTCQPATYYLNQFWNIKGHNRKTQFTFNAIGQIGPNPLPGSCSYGGESPDDGTYAYLVAQTNGVVDNICTPDWSKTLEKLGESGFGFRTNFFLTSMPDLTQGAIQVAIDGTPVPAVDAERGADIWKYDPVGNSVNFEPMYVPEPGQTLTITYHTTCYPL